MSERLKPSPRSMYPHFDKQSTRWNDNDIYGHINNAVHFQLFDSAVNRFLIDGGALDIQHGATVSFVVDNRCAYFSPIRYPDVVHVGIRVARMGNSSLDYDIGIFRNDDSLASAVGRFVHVYVDRVTNKPVPIPYEVKRLLAEIILSDE